MRAVVPVLVLLLFMPVAMAGFGDGEPRFVQLDGPRNLPDANDAAEPTIGIPWNTDSVFFQSGEATFRIRFDEAGADTWEDVTPPITNQENVDPFLHGDPDTGRVWAGGLQGACSLMSFTDDDGETWMPAGNMCTGAQFDHQALGSGPFADHESADAAQFPHATYYCAQLASTACITSLDGGQTWGPVTEVTGGCGGLHGHIRVSRTTGTAVVPHRSCDQTGIGVFVGDVLGFAYTDNNGLTWGSRFTPIPDSELNEKDPSIQFSRDSGWMYFGQANLDGAFIAMSKDEGLTWETIGANVPGGPAKYVEVGQLHEPAVVHAQFADVQVGDDDRVAFSFIGLEDKDGDGDHKEYPDNPFRTCWDESKALMEWHYYIATSYDAGDTWQVTKATTDPLQVGGVFDGQTAGEPEACRNILDFNDMDIDSQGRIHIGFADGCVDDCVDDPANARGESASSSDDADGFRTDYAALIRQVDGRGLFAEFDAPTPGDADRDVDGDGLVDEEDDDIDGDGLVNEEDPDPYSFDEQKSPASGLFVLLAVVGAALLGRRRTAP